MTGSTAVPLGMSNSAQKTPTKPPTPITLRSTPDLDPARSLGGTKPPLFASSPAPSLRGTKRKLNLQDGDDVVGVSFDQSDRERDAGDPGDDFKREPAQVETVVEAFELATYRDRAKGDRAKLNDILDKLEKQVAVAEEQRSRNETKLHRRILELELQLKVEQEARQAAEMSLAQISAVDVDAGKERIFGLEQQLAAATSVLARTKALVESTTRVLSLHS